MPLFRYSGTDRSGQPIEGTLQAASSEQATYLLGERGYRLSSLDAVGGVPQATSAPPIAARPAAPPAAIVPPMPAQPTTSVRQVRTRQAKDKDRYFLFAQLAEQVRAGISPADACTNVARHLGQEDLRNALLSIGKDATEGRSLSDGMAQYPDLFPEGVVGMVRAGEVGGFLPDALMQVSDHAGRAHKFKRWFWFVWVVGLNALIAIPLMLLMTRAMLATWRRMDSGGEGFSDALRQSYTEKILWPWGPLLLAALGVTFYLRYLFSSTRLARFRHNLGLKWPVIGARARHECVSTFSWLLASLSRSGIPPNQAWLLAADAVPNLAMREKLLEAGRLMRDGTKLSDAAAQSGLFPQEYSSIIATGEVVGDVPGSFQRLADLSHAEYEAAQVYAKARGGCWGLVGCAVTSGILLIIFFYFWYHELIGAVLEGLEPP